MHRSILLQETGNIHYIKRYINMIDSLSQSNLKQESFHIHHILPKSLYPEYKKEKWNLIKVSVKAHYILHHILARALGGKCYSAFYQMSIHPKLNLKITARQYNEAVTNFKILNKGVCTYRSAITGKCHRAHKEDYRVLSGEYVHNFKGKTLSPARVQYMKDTLVVFDSSNRKYCRVYKDENYFSKINSGEYIHTGKLRSEESRKKTGDRLRDAVAVTDGETIKFLKPSEEIPEGFRRGLPHKTKQKMSKASKNKNFYHSPVTGHQIKVYGDSVPEGYVKGRISFGRENDIMDWKYGINVLTGEKIKVNKDSCFPDFCINKSKKVVYQYINENKEVYVSGDLTFLARKFGFDIKPDMVYTVPFDKVTKKFSASLNDLGFFKIPAENFKEEYKKDWVWII